MKKMISLLFILSLYCSCSIENALARSSEKQLEYIAVTYNNVVYEGVVSHSEMTAQIDLPWNTYLSNLELIIRVSPKATYKLENNTQFSQPQMLTITAEDDSQQRYKLTLTNAQKVQLDHPYIEIEGCIHVSRTPEKIKMQRFNATCLADPRINYMGNGQTQSGVVIRFTTDSKQVKLKFTEIPGARWGRDYGVWADGQWYNNFTSHTFTLTKPDDRDSVTWEVTPSLMNAVDLTSIEIENGSSLKPSPAKQKPVYFAIGNSITQGVGQGNAGYKAYPFLLGQKLGYESYNLGVGGSKVSWKVATQLENQPADLITLLWGFNDWYFEPITAAHYKDLMLALIEKIRLYQPHTPLLCISLIGTEYEKPAEQCPIDDFRQAVKEIVEERKAAGDDRIYLLDGAGVNVELMDKVHPSVAGAADLADILHRFLAANQILTNEKKSNLTK